MRDPYLYEGTQVLKNKLGIVSQVELDRAEADYVSEWDKWCLSPSVPKDVLQFEKKKFDINGSDT